MNSTDIFKDSLTTFYRDLENWGYKFERINEFNSSSSEMFLRNEFINQTINKKLVITFYPCENEGGCLIEATIIGPDRSTIDVAAYLAYREKKAKISKA